VLLSAFQILCARPAGMGREGQLLSQTENGGIQGKDMDRPSAAKPSHDLFFIKLWAIT